MGDLHPALVLFHNAAHGGKPDAAACMLGGQIQPVLVGQ